MPGRVSTGPGETQTARTPCGPPTSASDLTKLKRPDFAAPYIAPMASASTPITLPIRQTTPFFAATMCGRQARAK